MATSRGLLDSVLAPDSFLPFFRTFFAMGMPSPRETKLQMSYAEDQPPRGGGVPARVLCYQPPRPLPPIPPLRVLIPDSFLDFFRALFAMVIPSPGHMQLQGSDGYRTNSAKLGDREVDLLTHGRGRPKLNVRGDGLVEWPAGEKSSV